MPHRIAVHVYCFVRTDMFAQDSVELLRNSGIDFLSHKEYGIDACDFGEHLIASGLVLNENIKWISFHRYDVVITRLARPNICMIWRAPHDL